MRDTLFKILILILIVSAILTLGMLIFANGINADVRI